MCSEEIGRHPNHSQLPKLNKVTEIPQIAIPLVDQVLDTLGDGSVFSVFDLFSGFTQLTIHPDTFPLTAFAPPTDSLNGSACPQAQPALLLGSSRS